jgi:hypothetical protein
MPVTLSSIAASSLTGSQASGQTGVDRVTQAFQKADKRIQQQRDLAAVQLSSFGKLKSAFADETARHPGSRASHRRVAQPMSARLPATFVKAFNSAVQTARSAATNRVRRTESNRARAAESELRRSVNSDDHIGRVAQDRHQPSRRTARW